MIQVSRSPNFLRSCSILAVISCLIMRQQSLSGIFLLEKQAGFSTEVGSFLSALALNADTVRGAQVCEMDFYVLSCSLLPMLLLDLDFFSKPLRWMQSFSFSRLFALLLPDSCDRLDDTINLLQTDTLRLVSCILCSKVAVFLRSEPRVEVPSASDQFLDETSMFFNSRASILPCL